MKASMGLETQFASLIAGGWCGAGLRKGQSQGSPFRCAVSAGLRVWIQSSMAARSASASVLPKGMRGVNWPLRTLTSGLAAGSPASTAWPYLLPPRITDSMVSMEKPLVLSFAEWHCAQFAARMGRIFPSKSGGAERASAGTASNTQWRSIDSDRWALVYPNPACRCYSRVYLTAYEQGGAGKRTSGMRAVGRGGILGMGAVLPAGGRTGVSGTEQTSRRGNRSG